MSGNLGLECGIEHRIMNTVDVAILSLPAYIPTLQVYIPIAITLQLSLDISVSLEQIKIK